MSKPVAAPLSAAAIPAPLAGAAAVPPPTPVTASGDIFVVDVDASQLRVRSEPRIDKNRESANVIAHLPDGHRVRRTSGATTDKFLEIENSLNGALIHGFSSTKFLVRDNA